jgi:hypothetical protein
MVEILGMKKIYLMILLLLALVGCSDEDTKTNAIHLIPEGYEGNLTVIYNVKGKPPLKTEDGYQVIPYNEKGSYLTSTPDMNYGTVTDKYFYIDSSIGERKEISDQCVYLGSTGKVQYNEGPEFPISRLVVTNEKKECSQDFMVNGPPNRDEAEIDELIKEELIKAKAIKPDFQ